MDTEQSIARMLESLESEIYRHFTDPEAASIFSFAKQVYQRITPQDVVQRDLSDIYGSLLGSWTFLQQRKAKDYKVRVFNPAYIHHGWQLGHTVVTVLGPNIPFMTDSLRGELNRRNITIHSIQTTIVNVCRNTKGQLQALVQQDDTSPPKKGGAQHEEALIYFEIDRHSDPQKMEEIAATMREILAEAAMVVGDFDAMLDAAKTMADSISMQACIDASERDEIEAFIHWLIAGNFTFLGYEKLAVEHNDGNVVITRDDNSCLGLMKQRKSRGDMDLAQEMKRAGSAERLLAHPITFSKSSIRSRIHRMVYPDYVRLKVFDEKQRVVAEHRLLGMYTSSVYTLSPTLIPMVRKKVAAVIERSSVDPLSHDGKDLTHLLEVFPRDELIQSTAHELFNTAMAVNRIQERRQVRLFVRRGHYGKFVNCLVYIPRELYNTELRNKIESILCNAYGAAESEFNTFFSESILIRSHFVLRVDPEQLCDVDEQLLEEEIIKVTMSWQDRLRNYLLEELGEEQGAAVFDNYGMAFTPGYRDDFDTRAAVNDILKIAELKNDGDIAMSFYRRYGDADNHLRFRLFQRQDAMALSDVMPILEHLGLRVLGEHPYKITTQHDGAVWLHEFRLAFNALEAIDIKSIAVVFEEAFSRIWYGDAESDLFNKLIIGAGLDWRKTAMLRAYAKYLKQIQFSFSTDYIAETLLNHVPITRSLINLFDQRFDPSLSLDKAQRQQKCELIEQQVLAALDEVENLSEDKVIRQYLAVISATMRTNFYQQGDQGQLKSYFSFKLLPAKIPEMPLPKPMFEIFVYSPWVEGVHLRGGKVARGGLRWSDRLEDFRTEVLGLVKAQQVKNAVIVPTGAKGGFVAKRPPQGTNREALQKEGIRCYQTFITALLDVTDNLVDGVVVPPEAVVRMDEDDSYLVVAADKGTATFSDIANEISARYGFWLGDAFASGGSAGYDHKKMGITARGAWVSVQRHFREMGINVQDTDFTVVGVGDMAGDVFGNGMLLSEHIQLTAAFNHLHIFIDPNPDSASSYKERQRLFDLPRSSWEDYNRELISKGGGVFKRSAKSITITPEMKRRFDISRDRMTPNELITALLKAPVDLFWNGGIGTYIKASSETHADVGDKANDTLRVNGNELRVKVIGEGGNLGVTQLGRVEFALKGGRTNTDFIDNAGGVDCSDHEVNIKILLNGVVANGDLTEKQRNQLLESMTDEVAELVLDNNYRQTNAISVAEYEASKRSSEYRRLIQSLESSMNLDRALEFLPTDEAIVERRTLGQGLSRPELSVLVSYAKSLLKESLACSSVPQNAYMAQSIESAFPPHLRKLYSHAIDHHRLRSEIIATQLANDIVNTMGIVYVDRIAQSTGAEHGEIAKAYVAARDIFDLPYYWQQVEDLDYSVASETQTELMIGLVHLVRRASRWFIRNRRSALDPAVELAHFRPEIERLVKELPRLIIGRALETWQHDSQQLIEAGVPEPLARYVGSTAELYPLLGIIDAAREIDIDTLKVAEVFFTLAQKLEIDWFAQQIAKLNVESHWEALARESFRDDLEWQMRTLTITALNHLNGGASTADCIDKWLDQHAALVGRWRSIVVELQGAEKQDFAMYSVAIRELLDMAQRSKYDDPN